MAEFKYGWEWTQARNGYLARNPLCVNCLKHGKKDAASVVDHIIPHRGDADLGWDEENWQALCGPCHNSHKQREEKGGYSDDLGADGWPTDPKHPANRSYGE